MELSIIQARSIARLLEKIDWEGGIGDFIAYEGATLDKASYNVPDDLRATYAEAAAAVRKFEDLLLRYEAHPVVAEVLDSEDED